MLLAGLRPASSMMMEGRGAAGGSRVGAHVGCIPPFYLKVTPLLSGQVPPSLFKALIEGMAVAPPLHKTREAERREKRRSEKRGVLYRHVRILLTDRPSAALGSCEMCNSRVAK